MDQKIYRGNTNEKGVLQRTWRLGSCPHEPKLWIEGMFREDTNHGDVRILHYSLKVGLYIRNVRQFDWRQTMYMFVETMQGRKLVQYMIKPICSSTQVEIDPIRHYV